MNAVKYFLKCPIAWFQDVPTTHGKLQALPTTESRKMNVCIKHGWPEFDEQIHATLIIRVFVRSISCLIALRNTATEVEQG